MSNGSKKYRLNKNTYEVKHNKRVVSEYYTNLRVLWEEIESMNDYPTITNVTPEVTAYVEVVINNKKNPLTYCIWFSQEPYCVWFSQEPYSAYESIAYCGYYSVYDKTRGVSK